MHRADAVLPGRPAVEPDPRRRRRSHRDGSPEVSGAARGHPRPLGGDDDRRAPLVPDARPRRAEGAGDQRQRLGDQEQVRQPVRLPRIAGRRHQARHRRDGGRQGRRHRRLRRRRQGLCPRHAFAGRPRDHHRDRSDQRPASGDGRLRGHDDGRGRAARQHLRHRHRQPRHHHAAST